MGFPIIIILACYFLDLDEWDCLFSISGSLIISPVLNWSIHLILKDPIEFDLEQMLFGYYEVINKPVSWILAIVRFIIIFLSQMFIMVLGFFFLGCVLLFYYILLLSENPIESFYAYGEQLKHLSTIIDISHGLSLVIWLPIFVFIYLSIVIATLGIIITQIFAFEYYFGILALLFSLEIPYRIIHFGYDKKEFQLLVSLLIASLAIQCLIVLIKTRFINTSNKADFEA